MRFRYDRFSASAASHWPRGTAWMQPRQISPRNAALLRMSAMPAAIQGLMSRPSTGAPKKIKNSCSSNGVPWKIWMKPVARPCAQRLSDVRASAMTRPSSAPPMKAISDSASVHLAASRMNRNSGNPKVRMGCPWP
jgi:hypothetical protein